MLDNGSLGQILRMALNNALARTSGPRPWQLPREKKTSGVRNVGKYGFQRRMIAHQGKREIARRKRQLDNNQLDFTASGQDIKGFSRIMYEAGQKRWSEFNKRVNAI